MRPLLLDTHIAIWFCEGSARLSSAVVDRIHDTQEIFVSAISLTEIAIKSNLGKLHVTADIIKSKCDIAQFQELKLSFDHALALAGLPAIHADPFDRMLIAQAKVEGITLITADKPLGDYGPWVEVV